MYNNSSDSPALYKLDDLPLLYPSSGAIELTSTMTMDATLMKTGLKMTSTLHTSTQANVLLKMQNGQVIQAKVDMPREKIEIASLKYVAS